MVTSTGKSAALAYMADIPRKMEPVLRGAARAGGKVFATEIKANTPSIEVAKNVRVRSRIDGLTIKVTVDVKPGWGRTVGIWLEWGTEGHFISVDDSQRKGRSVSRINRDTMENRGNHSLVIGGKFVGTTVWHPGARAQPVFLPTRDTKEAEAIAAAQAHIKSRVSRRGIDTSDEGDED